MALQAALKRKLTIAPIIPGRAEAAFAPSFMKESHEPQHVTLQNFYAEDKFGLLIDLRSMASQEMHGSGTRLVNTTDGVQLEIKRKTRKGPFNCHIFVISDAQFNIQNRQLDSVMY